MSGNLVSAAHEAAQGAAPYFFLSYAHTPKHDPADPDDPDAWVGTLYADLCKHIMALSDLPVGAKPGFMDRELRSGNLWPATLSHALATCRVFVPLYSRRYFESEQCGREWYAFSGRVLDAEAKGERRTAAIIPAIWVPMNTESMPEAARNIQFGHHELGDQYVAHGFYGIIKLSRFKEAYEMAVYELARRIVRVAEQEPVSPGTPADYRMLESAFSLAGQRDPGARRLRITVVAPSADNLPSGRGSYHYGHSPLHWNPYRPDSVRSLAEHACDLVRNLDYRPDVGDLDEHAEALTGNGPPTAPGLVLVDPWAAAQPECAAALQRFDALEKPWIQVVVPWNRVDRETADAGSGLRDGLDKSLRNKLAEGRATSAMAVRGVPSLEDFNSVLPAVLRTAVRQYLKHAKAHPPAGPAVEKPRLLWPTTDSERFDD
ncbi:MAG TPA: TIR-like protein FxsC [Streptosporangiaceae bacterium]|nr:TIR-like protein FxsC [Streptosporangiaceae bacterium]